MHNQDKELYANGWTQQQIADEFGVSSRTVIRDIQGDKNSVYTPKVSQSRDVTQYNITEYTKPETAAQKKKRKK